MRFVSSGREYVRNNNAKLQDAVEPTIIPPRALYYGGMVMNVPTGRKYVDEYGLKYTSPRPAETWVLNRWLYWKNSMSQQELTASLVKSGLYWKQSDREYDSTSSFFRLSAAILKGDDALEKEVQETSDFIEKPTTRTGAGIWESQAIFLRLVGIPKIFQTQIQTDR